MIGILAAAGMAGGLALVLSELTKQQMVSQKKAETGVEVVALSQRIVRTLYDEKACLNSLGVGTPINSSGGSFPISTIKSKTNNEIIATGKTYGNRLLKIVSMTVKSKSFTSGSGQAEATLEVVMSRENAAYKTGQRTVTKPFPLSLELDASDMLAGCASNAGAVIQGVCTALGGAWDPLGGGRCTLLMAEIGSTCPGNQVLKGFNSSGAKICSLAIANYTCPTGEALVGFSGGIPQCQSMGSAPPPPPPPPPPPLVVNPPPPAPPPPSPPPSPPPTCNWGQYTSSAPPTCPSHSRGYALRYRSVARTEIQTNLGHLCVGRIYESLSDACNAPGVSRVDNGDGTHSEYVENCGKMTSLQLKKTCNGITKYLSECFFVREGSIGCP